MLHISSFSSSFPQDKPASSAGASFHYILVTGEDDLAKFEKTMMDKLISDKTFIHSIEGSFGRMEVKNFGINS